MSVFDYEALCSTLEQLYRAYGVLPRVRGRTILGRAVFTLELGAGQNRSLILCGESGDEGPLCELTLRFARALLAAKRENTRFCGVQARQALSDCGVTIVPCLNPDGLALCTDGVSAAGPLRRFLRPLWQPGTPWKANAAGVDLRRQYSAGFSAARDRSILQGFTSPGASGFVGEAPLREPEARVLCSLCRKERFRHVLQLRRGEQALRFLAGESEPDKSRLCAKLLSQEAFLPLLPEEDADGAFSRWFTETTGRPFFTAQTGNGNAPLPEDALFSCMMLACLL